MTDKLFRLISPCLYLIAYMVYGYFFTVTLGLNSIFGTICANCAMLFCLYSFKGDEKPLTKKQPPYLFLLLLCFSVVIWFFSQSLSSQLYYLFGDSSFDKYVSTAGSSNWYVFVTLILAPLVEELLFRDRIFTELSKVFDKTLTCIITSFIFAVFHKTLVHLIPCFMSGLFFQYCYCKYGGVKVPIIMHSFMNFLSLVLGGVYIPEIFTNLIVLSIVNVLIIIIFTVSCYNECEKKSEL